MQTQYIREAPRDHRGRIAGAGVRVDVLKICQCRTTIVVIPNTEEHPGRRVLKHGGGIPGILERFPTHFQSETMLGIHRHGFARRNAEECRIEEIHSSQESTVLRHHRAGCVRICIEVRAPVPSFAGNFGNRVPSFGKQIPERGLIDHTSRKFHPHANDRNRFMLR